MPVERPVFIQPVNNDAKQQRGIHLRVKIIVKTMQISLPTFLVYAMTSWKSSLVGLAGIVLTYLTARQDIDISTVLHDPKFHMFILISILGLVVKDNNATGGNNGQPSTPQALADSGQAPPSSLVK